MPTAAPAPARSEGRLALALFALLAALVVGRALFDPSRVLLGVDTATQALPWSAVVPPSAEARPRNPGLSDQGLVFYPFYRWVSASWRAGDAPSWCPLIYAGAPGIGNPQSGALDPQVGVLVGLEALGGKRAFHWGFALLAFARLAAAGIGTYWLARELRLGRAASALAGVSFALSGYLVLWLGHSLGHVPPFLPWILLGLERLRGPRPAAAFALAALSMAGAVLGGHPETSFYVGAAAGLWALAIGREQRGAVWLPLAALATGALVGAASLLPFVEYLRLSAAQQVRAQQLAHPLPDLVALGLLIAAAAIAWLWRSGERPLEIHLSEHGEHVHAVEREGGPPLRNALGAALALAGVLMLLHRRGLPDTAWLALAHDLFGSAGDGELGYRGPGTYLEEASAWLPLITLGLAAAAVLNGSGALKRRKLAIGLGLAAALLCLRTPGVLELYRYLPVVGLGATVRLASVSALMLALLAGEALDSAGRAARTAAALLLALASLVPLLWGTPELPRAPASAPVDDTVGFLRLPAERLGAQPAELDGWLHPALPVDQVRLLAERLGEDGQPIAGSALEMPCVLGARIPSGAPIEPERLRALPEGARFFSAPFLQVQRLEPGVWRFSVRLFRQRADGPEELATRVARTSSVARLPGWSWPTIALALAALIALAFLPSQAGWSAWLLVALAALHGLWFARGQNPAVPEAEAFPPTATERVLARELGQHRFLADPLVLPPSTGLALGLRGIAGYDGLDVASFNETRRLAMQPGVHALLGWHARGVDLDSPVFRLMGVKLLALAEPLEHAGWELIAGPAAGAPEPAECWIYRARDPLPRAFVVPRVVPPAVLGELLARDARAFDPLALACAEGVAPFAKPCTQASVDGLEWIGNRKLRLAAELDGQGLLVLSEQHFPGWRAFVDGAEQPIVEADGMYRGLVLAPGRHAIEFRYEPLSLGIGCMLSALGAGLLIGIAVGLARRARAAEAARLAPGASALVLLLGCAALQGCAGARGEPVGSTPESAPAPAVDALRVELAGGVLALPRIPAESPLSAPQIERWLRRAGEAALAYYGALPLPRIEIELEIFEGSGIADAQTRVEDGSARVAVQLGADPVGLDLERDWVLVHELVHLTLPELPVAQHWMEEGLATYVEPLARARAGQLDAREVWSAWIERYPEGAPGPGGLDGATDWAPTYLGGALFWLCADVELRRASGGAHSLQSGLVELWQHSGGMRVHMDPDDALRVIGRAVDAELLPRLRADFGSGWPSERIERLWSELGLSTRDGRAEFSRSGAPAELRRQICRRIAR